MKSDDTADRFIKIINRLLIADRSTTVSVEGGLRLYPSEIHLILALGTGQAANFAELVENLGITKGAVSQTVSRLVKKGVLYKKRGGNELDIVFTPLGRKALDGCKLVRTGLIERMSSYFMSLSADETKTINSFFSHMEDVLDTDLGGISKI